jgi:threonyl-tRNA synthetase
VIGDREVADSTVAVRKRGAEKKQEVMAREEFAERVLREIASKTLG